jgi:hypothetical protein
VQLVAIVLSAFICKFLVNQVQGDQSHIAAADTTLLCKLKTVIPRSGAEKTSNESIESIRREVYTGPRLWEMNCALITIYDEILGRDY